MHLILGVFFLILFFLVIVQKKANHFITYLLTSLAQRTSSWCNLVKFTCITVTAGMLGKPPKLDSAKLTLWWRCTSSSFRFFRRESSLDLQKLCNVYIYNSFQKTSDSYYYVCDLELNLFCLVQQKWQLDMKFTEHNLAQSLLKSPFEIFIIISVQESWVNLLLSRSRSQLIDNWFAQMLKWARSSGSCIETLFVTKEVYSNQIP